jgi:CDP-paratose 2-epimerase
MKTLITGICGFVGDAIARGLRAHCSADALEIVGIDNFSRQGSELNRAPLKKLDITIHHGDIRLSSDLDTFTDVDWVIDAAANPSVLAGVDGRTSSRQLVEHNLFGTINLLEFCKARNAGLILLSTSRVYSVAGLASISVETTNDSFRPISAVDWPTGLSRHGVAEGFSTEPPISLYGATKLASEQLSMEYSMAFGFPVWINRCGVLAGGGQFGRPDQGIFSFWINSWLRKRPLKYVGFDGKGHQVRDCLHPRDLVALLRAQMNSGSREGSRVINLGGGVENSISLARLSSWCEDRFGKHHVSSDFIARPFDIPWLVMDTELARRAWGWKVQTPLLEVLGQIAEHATQHPDWLEIAD